MNRRTNPQTGFPYIQPQPTRWQRLPCSLGWHTYYPFNLNYDSCAACHKSRWVGADEHDRRWAAISPEQKQYIHDLDRKTTRGLLRSIP